MNGEVWWKPDIAGRRLTRRFALNNDAFEALD